MMDTEILRGEKKKRLRYWSLTKMEDYENCMLEFLNLEILRKQEIKNIENQR